MTAGRRTEAGEGWPRGAVDSPPLPQWVDGPRGPVFTDLLDPAELDDSSPNQGKQRKQATWK